MTIGTTSHDHDHDYSVLLTAVQLIFNRRTDEDGHLFQTPTEGLWDLYLDNLDPAERQLHNCACCRRFIETYGGLVTIDEQGITASAMWAPADATPFYREAFFTLAHEAEHRKIIGPFESKEKVWGTPKTGDWTHLSVMPPARIVYRERALTPGQAMAAARESYKTVQRALVDFKAPMLDQALRLLEGEHLARSEKFIGPVKWLRDLQDRPKGQRGENILWRAIAAAPEGYLHPRSSVIGPLLEDIEAGMDFEQVKRRFDAKLHPLAYQRPQAAPTAGNLKAAEALVEKLGLARSLERRFARISECKLSWQPTLVGPTAPGAGVFGHLAPKGKAAAKPISTPRTTMTWSKFVATVLPLAERIGVMVPHTGSFIALTSAQNMDAPPIIKWDQEGQRNPVSWYVYPGGSPAVQWGLVAYSWADVTGICAFPSQWGPVDLSHHAIGAVLILGGAVDSRSNAGNGLFPEHLKSDLNGIRATVEAYARSAHVLGRENASACGYDLRNSSAVVDLRVLRNGTWDEFHIDRWD